MKLKPEEAVIGSKQILNHPTTIKQPYFAWSDCQQVFSRNSGITYVYQHMRVVMPWTKVSYRLLQVFYHSNKLIKTISRLFQLQYNFNLTDIYNPQLQQPANNPFIKTHDSESRGQEETATIRKTKNTQPLSELFIRKSV